MSRMGNGFILFVNCKGENVNFIARSNIDLDAGEIVKMASTLSSGNGGGSKTFAQGGGKTTKHIQEIFDSIKEKLS